MTTEAPFVLSVKASPNVNLEQTVAIEGVQAWGGSAECLKTLPAELVGGTLVRFPYKPLPANTSVALTVAGSDARVYLATEGAFPGSPANTEGDFARRIASTPGWLPESSGLKYGEVDSQLVMFSMLAQRGVPMVLPTIVKKDSLVVLVVVPITCGSFAVSITSNSSASYEQMVLVTEGVTAWNDRDHKYLDVPSCLLNGLLFQGPYKDVPDGTVLTVRPNARARVFIVLERSCSGCLHESLETNGWHTEQYAPRWHAMPTMIMFSRDCSAGAALTLPATKGDAQPNAATFSVVVVPAVGAVVAPCEVSCVSSRVSDCSQASTQLEPVPLAEGTVAWLDEAHVLVNVPAWMVGATLFRGPHRGPVPGSVFTVRAAAPSVVYVVVEEEFDGGDGRSAGLLPNVLPDEKWERRDEAPAWNLKSKLAVFARRVQARETLATPVLNASSDGCIVALVVKVDTADVLSFDASVRTSTNLEYGRAHMEESAIAWSDCQNRFIWVPKYCNGGILFRGPHCMPVGTRVCVNANGPCRVYVIVEFRYKDGQPRTGGFLVSLPAEGWQTEVGAPSWGDKKSDMKTFSRMIPEGVELQLPATNEDAVFSIVVVGLSTTSDRLEEEVKRVFKAWDRQNQGGIQRRDLEAFIGMLCPDLAEAGREALMDSLDPSRSGYLSYEEFIHKILVPR